MKTFLFNPYTGTPRHPSDITIDPDGMLIMEPEAPVMSAPNRAGKRYITYEPSTLDSADALVSYLGFVCSIRDEPSSEDRDRIVACWNACVGISTSSPVTYVSQFLGARHGKTR